MKILFVGDVVGSPGRKMISEYLPRLKKKYRPQVTIVNGENAAGGRGITEKIYRTILESGAQAVTLGNHAWDNKEIFEFIEDAPKLVRPANFPDAPGRGSTILNMNGTTVGVINLQGRAFLPPLDCPFRKIDEMLEEMEGKADIIFVDFHAEATSEKLAMGWYLDGRVSAVVGTHTHVQTADNRILPKGTAYISDVGMTGPYDGILGMEREAVLTKFLTNLPVRFEVDKGREQLSAVLIDINEKTGASSSIKRIMINEDFPFFE